MWNGKHYMFFVTCMACCFILCPAFCPFHIGQFTVILLSLEEVVSKSLKHPFMIILKLLIILEIGLRTLLLHVTSSTMTSPKVVNLLYLYLKDKPCYKKWDEWKEMSTKYYSWKMNWFFHNKFKINSKFHIFTRKMAFFDTHYV